MLIQALSTHHELKVVHSAAGAQEASLTIAPGSVDVAVMDVNLGDGNGIVLGGTLQSADPSLGILLLSSQDSLSQFHDAQTTATKPWSYLSKRSAFAVKVLHTAVFAAARGDVVIDPYLVRRSTPRDDSIVAALTPAQLTVLELVAEGLSNEAIAEALSISARSVESHLGAVYRRLELEDPSKNRRVSATLAYIAQTTRTPGRS